MRRLSDQTVAAFYDKLSVHYDVMTGFTERFAREGTTFRELINRYRISSAVDAGCGSGFHSCLLAQLGVDVTGVDVSPAMLSLAATHARERNVDVKFIESSFEDIPAKVKATMDGIFCLGNSLPHLPSREGVRKALRSFLAVLKPGGVLFIQLLNYDRILSRRSRVQSVKEEGGSIFVRFYDFEPRRIRFNALTLRRSGNNFQHAIESVDLRPIGRAELAQSLSAAGFQGVRMFGNAKLEVFDPDTSSDLFVVAMKYAST